MKELIEKSKRLELELIERLNINLARVVEVNAIISANDMQKYGKHLDILTRQFLEDKNLNELCIENKIKITDFLGLDGLQFSLRQPVDIAYEIKEISNAIKLKKILERAVNEVPFENVQSFVADIQNKIIREIEHKEDSKSDINSVINKFYEDQQEYQTKKQNGDELIGISTGFTKLDNAIDGIRPGHLWVFGGYCLGKGTKVLMKDGKKKNVEDIKQGELLSPVFDKKPRKVLAINQGTEEMFEISGKYIDTFSVNYGHELYMLDVSCGYKKEKIVKKKAGEFVKLSQKRQKHFRLLKTPHYGVDKVLPIEPYFLGYWLGDGTTGTPNITIHKENKEIINYVKDYAKRLEMDFSYWEDKRQNNNNVATIGIKTKRGDISIRKNALVYKLPKSKLIPDVYFKAGFNQRLELLAGLIDSDGSISGVSKTYFTFYQKDIQLTNQVKELAESCGFNTKLSIVYQKESKLVKNCNGNLLHKLCISGMTYLIPNKISIKKVKNKTLCCKFKDKLPVTFSIKSIGKGEYYGFELDGNHLFLAQNNIVNHNTNVGKTFASLNIVANLIKQNKRVVYYSIEMNSTDILSRILGILTNDNGKSIVKGYAKDKDKVKENIEKIKQSKLSIHSQKSETSEILFSMYEENLRDKVDLFVVDFLQIMTVKNSKSEYETTTTAILSLQQIAKRLNIPVMVLSQISNESAKVEDAVVMGFKGSGAIASAADLAIELKSGEQSRQDWKQKIKEGKLVKIDWSIKKNRHGSIGKMEMAFNGNTGIFEDYETSEANELKNI
jgi:replicative DNA helicase